MLLAEQSMTISQVIATKYVKTTTIPLPPVVTTFKTGPDGNRQIVVTEPIQGLMVVEITILGTIILALTQTLALVLLVLGQALSVRATKCMCLTSQTSIASQ